MNELESAFESCVQTVRAENRPRYISLAYASAGVRPNLCALFAFEVEMQRILEIVREPMAGEIRLQWWRDAIATGERSVPLAAALNATIEEHQLPTAVFDALLDARISDLYADPPATLGDAEGHAGETRSVIYQMAAQVLYSGEAGRLSERSGHAGVLSYWLDALAHMQSPNALRRAFIPRDQLALWDVNADEPFDPSQCTGAQTEAMEAWLMAEAQRHSRAVFAGWQALSPAERMPYLDLVPKMKSAASGKPASPLRSLWSIWRAANGMTPVL